MSNKEKSCSSPMLFRYSMSITQQLMPIYNTTVHKNNSNVALNVDKPVSATRHQHATRAEKEKSDRERLKVVKLLVL